MEFDDNGYMISGEGSGGGSNLYFKDGTFRGNYVQQTILIDYISDTEISGTFKDGAFGNLR
ncbi:hypothetical protein ACFSF3_13145 [Vibrio chagasii]